MTKQEIINQYLEIESEVKELKDIAENTYREMDEIRAEDAEQEMFEYVRQNGIYFSNEAPYIRVRD
jgi:hypothetical protein